MSSSSKTLTRRDVLRTVGLSAGGLLLLDSIASAAISPGMATAGSIYLELDGTLTPLQSVEGGNGFADVLVERLGVNPQPKRPGTLHFEELVLQLPFRAAAPLAAWIADASGKGQMRRSGAIVYADYNRSEWKRLEFTNAAITEIGLPPCDAADGKSAMIMTLRIAPEFSRWAGGSGKNLAAPLGSKAVAIGANFRLLLKGFEAANANVSRVEGLGLKRQPLATDLAAYRGKDLPPFDVTPLKIKLRESSAGPYYSWFENVVLNGNNGAPDAERTGRIEWLDTTLTQVIASADLVNLGITRYAPDKVAQNTSTIAMVEVNFYCENLGLTLTDL
jgi:hypothetical protein